MNIKFRSERSYVGNLFRLRTSLKKKEELSFTFGVFRVLFYSYSLYLSNFERTNEACEGGRWELGGAQREGVE